MRGMCAKREEEEQEGGECSINHLEIFEEQFILPHHQQHHHDHHHHHDYHHQQQQMQQNMVGGDLHLNSRCFIFPTNSTQILPSWAFNQPPPYPTRDQDPFLHTQPPQSPPPHQSVYDHASTTQGLMFTNRNTGSVRVGGGGGGGMMMNNINGGFGYEVVGGGSSACAAMDHLRIFSETLGQVVQGPGGSVSGGPFGLQSELAKMTAQEIMDAKALAASKSHSEAERRRRERINNHLAKLRSLLPNTTKTDKASLLAEVIQHVKELKRQTSLIVETSPVPTEVDELTVNNASDEDGRVVIRASLCCEDRSDLLPDLIKTLKALRLRTLKAEITTLGGRVKNVLFITGEEDSIGEEQMMNSITSIQEALKAVMEKTNGDDSSSGSVKRQRTNVNILNEHRSI